MTAASLAFSKIDDAGVFGTIYDSQVLTSRECYGAHMMYVIVDDEKNPTIVFKEGAVQASARNHGITHAAGQNAPEHEYGPKFDKRPLNVGNLFSYGWSAVGNAGFSGGTTLGVGPNGENLAGHIVDGYVSWLGLIPNHSAEIVSVPSELEIEIEEMGTLEATINKDIGNENWSWIFTKGPTTLTENSNPVSISFSEAGIWNYTVVVTNDCGGQSDTLSGSFIVNSAQMMAPVVNCQNITVFLDADGLVIVPASDINNGSSDSDGTIMSMQIDNTIERKFVCTNLGNNNDVTFTATDNDGLSSSCMANVTVVDDIALTIECVGDITIQLTAGQDTTLDVNNFIVDVFDNCTYTVSASQLMFDDMGTFPVTVGAIDDSGNETICVVDVTVDVISSTIIVVDDRISIYPNPVTDLVNIKIDDSLDVTKVSLFDSQGRKIKESNYSSQFSVEHIPKGIYSLVVTTPNDVFINCLLKL